MDVSVAKRAGPSPTLVTAAAIASTIAAAIPVFLAGALAVQVSDEFVIAEGAYGLAITAFFGAAAVVSRRTGTLVQRIGAKRQIVWALAGTIVIDLVVAFWTSSFWMMVAALAVAGMTNSACQTAVNFMLTRAQLPRLGLSIAIKQSGMPLAALLGGLAVPAIALTVGWRWAYVGAGVAAVGAVGLVLFVLQGVDLGSGQRPTPTGRIESEQPLDVEPPTQSSTETLVLTAIAMGFLAFSSGALAAWPVSSGVDAGLSEGAAGLAVGVGSGAGISMRLLWGLKLDKMRRSPLWMAAANTVVGAVGMAALGFRVSTLHIVATAVAFGAGWVWPVFMNFGIMSANRETAGAATGITQTGVYFGVFVAPLATGQIIDQWGYQQMWTVVALSGLVGAYLIHRLTSRFEVKSCLTCG